MANNATGIAARATFSLGGFDFPISDGDRLAEDVDIPDHKIDDAMIGRIGKVRADFRPVARKSPHVRRAHEPAVLQECSGLSLNPARERSSPM